jgi:hypothetical protein
MKQYLQLFNPNVVYKIWKDESIPKKNKIIASLPLLILVIILGILNSIAEQNASSNRNY